MTQNFDFNSLLSDTPAPKSKTATGGGFEFDSLLEGIEQPAKEEPGLWGTLVNSAKRGIPGLSQVGSATAFRSNANSLQQIDEVERLLASGRKPETITSDIDPVGVAAMTKEQRAEYRKQVTGAAAGNAQNIIKKQAEKDAIPTPEVVGKVSGAKTFKEAFSELLKDPVTFVAAVGPESLVQNAPGLAAAAVMPGGIVAKGATMGASSGAVDYGSSILEALGEEGVDIKDERSLMTAVQDKSLMDRVAKKAMAHAGAVGTVDALSGGAAFF